MALIEWKDAYNTGVAEVDHEHQELIQLINDLHAELEGGDQATVGDFLGEVFAKIAAHFALEETVMRKHRYDEYEAHKAEHERLLDEIRDIMDDQEAGAYADASDALATTVRDWFVNHFKTKDARLHKKLGV
jgi:hemerythrin-like metal-binding protein